MPKPIEIKAKGLTVNIFVTQSTKNGKSYTSYQVADYSSGKRKLKSYADLEDAKAKANQIAGATATGEQDMISLHDCKRNIQLAIELVGESSLVPACHIFREASKLIDPEQILEAVRFYRDNRPDKPFTPKSLNEATSDYLTRQSRLSARRKRGLKCYFDQLCKKLGDHNLHEITPVEIKDFMDTKKWANKTYNESLTAYSLIFKEAQLRDWVPDSCNPVAKIKRMKLLPGSIGIFEPQQARTMLSKVKEDLVPFLAIWLFAGCRKEEVARLRWAQIRRALKTGVLEITSDVGQKTGARCVPLQSNLIAWLSWFLRRNPDIDGPVLPMSRQGNRRLDDIQKRIGTQSKIEWVPNGPRHSYISYRSKLAPSITDVADEAGNSPAKIERHYRRKGVTVESAREFFAILPPSQDNVIPMPTEEKQPSKLAATG